ncbi:MAG: cardiolipin synthase [Oscillospiraceae bacterium]
MRNILKHLTGRLCITIILILIQVILLITFFTGLWNCSIYIQLLCNVIGLIFVLIIFNGESNPVFKLSWTILILVLPLGWILYLIFHINPKSEKEVLKYSNCLDLTTPYVKNNHQDLSSIEQENPEVAKLFRYVQNTSNMGTFRNTGTKFYPCGEYFFLDYIEDLKSAKKYIFMEYFIISYGTMWNTVLDILKDKAKQGVEIRLMYDDMGTISQLKYHYDDYLNSLGIKTVVFNRVRAFPNASLSYRDHRKITIIDGNIAYTGGLNLSDEYINLKERFGYWKDSALKIYGEAVHSMILMFLQLWNYSSYKDKNTDLSKYFITTKSDNFGYVQPFHDTPFDKYLISENVYMGIINSAKKYVYICTPYLILDNEMVTSLKMASQSGVDVRIITPNIPDKKYVYSVTRSNYKQLLNAGVRIFEFKDGFIHSKTIIADDTISLVGTANFDFRSFYLHFENGVLMYNTDATLQVKNDCVEMFKNHCIEVTLKDCENYPLWKKLMGFFLKLISPIL